MNNNKYDLTGQKFGKLTVVEQTRKNNKKAWRCICECGNEKISFTADLRAGKTTSCGCGRRKNIANQRFGRLIAIKPTTQKDGNNSIIWECQCDCGNKHYVSVHNLTTGNVQSCGCARKEAVSAYNKSQGLNLVGQHFGLLTVLEQVENQGNHRRWKCKCECGKTILVTSSALLHCHQYSCGCVQQSQGETKIVKILSDANIKFEQEKTFNDLIFEDTNRAARYDFYLPEYNTLIEYDGKQHYIQSTGYYDNEEKFLRTQEHDKIKNQYAKNNNIILIRIPYTHLDNIILNDLLPLTSKFII